MGVSFVLSGFVLPLPFFPDWLEAIARVLPFAAMVQIPIDVFLEQATGAEVAGLLLLQALWAVILLGLARIVLGAAIRQLVVQGG
jgi:ABC-2 type transport system permease protein